VLVELKWIKLNEKLSWSFPPVSHFYLQLVVHTIYYIYKYTIFKCECISLINTEPGSQLQQGGGV
jgi:hypothetical protein